VVASGGALTHSSQWLRIITDVLGLPVSPSRVEEPSARGVSLLGLEALGFLRDLKDVPDFIGPPFRPNAAWHGRYKEAAKRQKELYRKLIGKDPSSIGIHRGGQL
jgi:sugar (pentulose or hexulose) kinase